MTSRSLIERRNDRDEHVIEEDGKSFEKIINQLYLHFIFVAAAKNDF